jgi:hypothetical protein
VRSSFPPARPWVVGRFIRGRPESVSPCRRVDIPPLYLWSLPCWAGCSPWSARSMNTPPSFCLSLCGVFPKVGALAGCWGRLNWGMLRCNFSVPVPRLAGGEGSNHQQEGGPPLATWPLAGLPPVEPGLESTGPEGHARVSDSTRLMHCVDRVASRPSPCRPGLRRPAMGVQVIRWMSAVDAGRRPELLGTGWGRSRGGRIHGPAPCTGRRPTLPPRRRSAAPCPLTPFEPVVEHALEGPASGVGQARPIRTESTGGR